MKTFDDWFMGSPYYEDATVEDEEKYRTGWEASNECAGNDKDKEIEAMQVKLDAQDAELAVLRERLSWYADGGK